jgi:uncharacterized OsmC-like protein
MVQITVRYEGDLRCRAVHGPSGTQLSSDAPLDNQGRGESFSPTDLVATALGTCMLTVMGIAAKRNGWDLAGAEVRIEKSMVNEPVRRIGKLAATFEIPGVFGAEARRTLERAALTCPVQFCLHPDIEVPVEFHWAGGPAPCPAKGMGAS